MLKYEISFKTRQVQISWGSDTDNTPTANQSPWFLESAMIENFFFKGG